jgi:uncharacterized membrane protein YphA (DoxX/SURF4 family)
MTLACISRAHPLTRFTTMTLIFSGFLLGLFGLSLILITLSLRFLRGAAPAGESYCSPARLFLIALRLAIGWHCFVEGMEKITAPHWSSETYLRESMGPASGAFRWIAGDRLLAKVTVGPDESFPAELDREWRDYLNAFAAYYKLTSEQIERAQAVLAERKKDTLAAFAKAETVTKISAYPPDLKIDMTMNQRLDEHERLSDRVRKAEAKFPTTDKDVHAEWKTARADLARWRAELKKSIDAETAKLKKIDEADRAKWKKSIDALTETLKKTDNSDQVGRLTKSIESQTSELNKHALTDLLTSEQKQAGPMPEPKTAWRMLEISDFMVKWGLVVLGGCLMLGLCSRGTSLATALLLFSFYAAMPPLPGWPESPRLEGHYLLVNKTLIEVIALLALTFIPTGRWAGLDGLLCVCCGGNRTAPVTPTAAEMPPKATPAKT